MSISTEGIVFLAYFFVFLGIQVVILMGYINLHRKHNSLKIDHEKLRAEVEELKGK
jgi:hypothetical protein